VDVTTGITDLDDAMTQILRMSKKPVLVVVNKADNDQRRWQASEFYQLGLGEIYAVSAVNGTGTGELLDDLVKALPEEPSEEEHDHRLRIAVIGRPNVGKSSLANAILGFPRSIVTEIPGTTRDAVHSVIQYEGREIVLIDTAGLRKKSRVKENIEFYSTLRTQRAIEECDIAALLLDAVEGLQAQDIRVLKEAEDMRKGLLIAVNKWDLVEKETNTARDYERQIYSRLPMLDYVPIVFVSALTKQRVQNVLRIALSIDQQRSRRVPTSELNEVMLKAIERHHPPTYRNQFIKIKYVTQVRENPPVFVFFCNYPKGVHESYRRYLENQLREAFGFQGVPLTLVFKAKAPQRA
jgi:GTP-binding protein